MTTLLLRLSMRGFIVLWCVLFVGGATLDEDMYSFAAASPNFVLSNGTPLLTRACEIQNVELVRILLDSGADVNSSVSGTRVSPLMVAVLGNNSEILRLLVEAHADIN